jgi:hypothetical protein
MPKSDQERIGIVETEIVNLKDSDSKQWSAIDVLKEKYDTLMRKWVPVWVTIGFTIMGAMTGSALTFAGMVMKYSSSFKSVTP